MLSSSLHTHTQIQNYTLEHTHIYVYAQILTQKKRGINTERHRERSSKVAKHLSMEVTDLGLRLVPPKPFLL